MHRAAGCSKCATALALHRVFVGAVGGAERPRGCEHLVTLLRVPTSRVLHHERAGPKGGFWGLGGGGPGKAKPRPPIHLRRCLRHSHHVEHRRDQIDVKCRIVDHQSGRDSRAPSEEWHADVSLVEHSLIVQHSKLAEVKAVVRRVQEVGIVQDASCRQKSNPSLDHVVDGPEHRPPPLKVDIGYVDVARVHRNNLPQQPVLVLLGRLVPAGDSRRRHASIGLVILWRLVVGSVAGRCPDHRKERGSTLCGVCHELKGAVRQPVREIISRVITAVLFGDPVVRHSITVVLGVTLEPIPLVPPGWDSCQAADIGAPIRVEVLATVERGVSKSLRVVCDVQLFRALDKVGPTAIVSVHLCIVHVASRLDLRTRRAANRRVGKAVVKPRALLDNEVAGLLHRAVGIHGPEANVLVVREQEEHIRLGCGRCRHDRRHHSSHL
mmetsp:Transcript_4906/g.12685  ORF Transcript_4906/g.12685 Transcript_4906/m.12685 type:complete len:438 (+) Transcript_4906:394-1707(+)